MHVKISNAAKFQSCRPKTQAWQTFEKPENKRQMYGIESAKLHLNKIIIIIIIIYLKWHMTYKVLKQNLLLTGNTCITKVVWVPDLNKWSNNLLEMILQSYVEIKWVPSILKSHSNKCMTTCRRKQIKWVLLTVNRTYNQLIIIITVIIMIIKMWEQERKWKVNHSNF